MKRNPAYEAGYRRAVDDDDLEPEDLLTREARAGRTRRFALIAALLAAMAVAAGFGLHALQDSPAKQLDRGRQARAKNQHQTAIVEFKRALLDEPNQPAVRVLLGEEYVATGDPRAAEIEFRKAVDARFQLDRTLPLLLATLVRQERYERVIVLVNNAALETPQANADLQAMLGTAYFGTGRLADADAAWKAAKDFVPEHPGALMAESRALTARGDFETAQRLLDRVPATAARQDERYALRGDIARALGRTGEAATAYEAAVALDPGNLPLRLHLAQADVELARFDEAARQVQAIFVAMPNHPRAQYIAAQIAAGRKDWTAAGDAIMQSVQQMPRDGRAQMLAGTIAAASGRFDEAELHLREAVGLLPKSDEAKKTLARFHLDRHETAKAAEVVEPLFAAHPGDAEVAGLEARLARLQRDPVKGAKAYDRVDPAGPDGVATSLAAASLKFAAGDRAGGLVRLRAAAAAHPRNGDVDAALVAAFVQARQVKDATVAWDALRDKQPDAPRTWRALSTIDLARGDDAAARRSLEKAAGLDVHDFGAVNDLVTRDLAERKVDDARMRLRRFVAADPSQVDAALRLVRIEQDAGAGEDVVLGLLRDARKNAPRSADALAALAAYHAEHGDAKQALAVADEGLAFAPGDTRLLAVAGSASLAIGDTGRAVAFEKRLSAADAESADAAARLGAAQLAAGQPEAALAAYRLALRREPDRVDLHRAMVTALLSTGKAAEADRLLFEINRLAPRSPALPELDADVKLGRRLFPEAIAAYRRALAITPDPRLAIRTYEALIAARQIGEAGVFWSDWRRVHASDEAVLGFDADLAIKAGDDRRARDDLRALRAARPNDAVVAARLAAVEGRIDGTRAASVAATPNEAPGPAAGTR